MTTFPESECACTKCADMCRKFPCRPTPTEVTRMPRPVQARLMLDGWGTTLHEVPHLQAGAKGYEGTRAPDFKPSFGSVTVPHACTFLTPDGLCELHGKCKPLEGRVSHHDETVDGRDFLKHMGALWESPLGNRVLMLWSRRHLAKPADRLG